MTKEQSERAKLAFNWGWEVASKVAMPVLLGIAGWTHTRLMDLDGRVIRIESTRYTAEDARRDSTASRAELRADMESIRATLTANTALLLRLDERIQALQRENGR